MSRKSTHVPPKPAPIEEVQDVKASAPETQPEIIRGRVLVDVPAHDLKCGEFVDLPVGVAEQLRSSGQFDPEAEE